MATIKDQLAAALARIAALEAAPAQASARSADGRDFPCTAPEPCGRSLRSKARAAVHGNVSGSGPTAGHDPRTAASA
jgi:hypothetical protein